jgi:enterobactin synthetase component F
VTRNNLRLARQYVPQLIDADLLFFHATANEPVELDGLLQYHPRAWRSFVGGRIETHEIDCHHQNMLEAGPAAQIGGLLQQKLTALHAAKSALPTLLRQAVVPEPMKTVDREMADLGAVCV